MLHVLVITSCVYIMYCALITSSTSMCDPLKSMCAVFRHRSVHGYPGQCRGCSLLTAEYSYIIELHNTLKHQRREDITNIKPVYRGRYLITCR